MRKIVCLLLAYVLVLSPFSAFGQAPVQTSSAGNPADFKSSVEEKFRALPEPNNIRENMRRLSARPHHVGSPYDKDNAEWLLSKFKEYGWDAHIERFDVLFPTPKERLLE